MSDFENRRRARLAREDLAEVGVTINDDEERQLADYFREFDSGEAVKLDERRPQCRCRPWEQRWRPDTPERCATCGGLFPPRSVAARRPRPGDEA